MITTLLLGLLAGGLGVTSWRQRRRAGRAEATLARLRASTDDELTVMLELADTPLARRLLGAMRETPRLPKPKAGQNHPLWAAFWPDFQKSLYEQEALNILRIFVDQGMTVTAEQYNKIIDEMEYVAGAEKARRILKGKIVDGK